MFFPYGGNPNQTAKPKRLSSRTRFASANIICSLALCFRRPLYGEYSIADNIMLGYAVDEAASWHETTDWIGVILTPSAKMFLRNDFPEFVMRYDAIPFKRSMKSLNLCVRWVFDDDKKLYDIIQKKGPHVPEIAPKYLNTLNFLQPDDD